MFSYSIYLIRSCFFVLFYSYFSKVSGGWDSVVGIAICYRLDGPGFWTPGAGEIFCTRPDQPRGSPILLYNKYRVFFPGAERPRCGVDSPCYRVNCTFVFSDVLQLCNGWWPDRLSSCCWAPHLFHKFSFILLEFITFLLFCYNFNLLPYQYHSTRLQISIAPPNLLIIAVYLNFHSQPAACSTNILASTLRPCPMHITPAWMVCYTHCPFTTHLIHIYAHTPQWYNPSVFALWVTHWYVSKKQIYEDLEVPFLLTVREH
jgi:hypothetical protein